MILDAVSDLVNNTVNAVTTSVQNRKNRESQEAMNASNIQAQKDINAQNLANQDYWNRVTMDREDAAWQRASNDIQNAGLSKALLTGGASATPLATANQIAPRGDAFTGNKAPTFSGNTVGGLAEIAGAIGIANLISKIKDGNNGKRSDGSSAGRTASVDTPDGIVEVSYVEPSKSNGNSGHFNTRNIPLTKLVASPIDVDHPDGFVLSSYVNGARVASSNNRSSQNAIGNAASVLKGALSPDSKKRLAKFIKLTQATPDGNLEFKPGMRDPINLFGSPKLTYEKEVPSLLNPVCAELIQHGVVDNQADAQMYIGNLVYTIKTDDSPRNPSKETLEKMLGVSGFGYGKHESHSLYGKHESHSLYPKHYTTSGAGKYKAHD